MGNVRALTVERDAVADVAKEMRLHVVFAREVPRQLVREPRHKRSVQITTNRVLCRTAATDV